MLNQRVINNEQIAVIGMFDHWIKPFLNWRTGFIEIASLRAIEQNQISPCTDQSSPPLLNTQTFLLLGDVAVSARCFVDAFNQSHVQAKEDCRIISLVPSLTETLFDLGLKDNLVARTAFCIHPSPEVKSIKSIGGTKQVNMEKLLPLNASHLIVNIDENPKELVDELRQHIPNIIVTHPNRPEDNFELFKLLGGVFNREKQAEKLCADLQVALTNLRLAAQDLPKLSALYFIWNKPWMTISSETYISRTLALANITTHPEISKSRYPEVDPTDPAFKDLDAILFSSEPFAFNDQHIASFAKTFGFPEQKLFKIDGEMTSWYGSRAIASLHKLYEFRQGLGI